MILMNERMRVALVTTHLPIQEVVAHITEEAVLQMNLLSHQFFAFRNAETGNIGVVYLRSDGSYGVIDCVD